MDMKGKSVIITGAGRGIGRAVALDMARAGASVFVNALDQESLDGVLDEVRRESTGGKCAGYVCDVGSRENVERMYDHMVAELGGVDVVVNNAAICYAKPFLQYDDEWWDENVRVNLSSVYYMCHRGVREMIKRGSKGSIINLSSIGATRAHRNVVAYDACKGAVEALTRALALETAPWEIRVNAISPASILGFYVPEMDPEKAARKDPNDFQTPLPRQGTPGDVANLVRFLASDASGYITGQVISIDGGLGIQSRPHQLSPLIITPQNIGDFHF